MKKKKTRRINKPAKAKRTRAAKALPDFTAPEQPAAEPEPQAQTQDELETVA